MTGWRKGTEGDRGSPSKPILGEGTRMHVHMSQYDWRGPGQSLKTHPGWRYSSACPYVPLWPKGTGAVPQNPSWVKVLECMSICPNMTEGDRGSPSKPILGEGTRVHVHMSQYDRRGPGQSLKTHPGWRYSSACPYVPIWPKGTGAVPQNPSWVKVLKCMSICPIMTEGDRGSPSKPILGEGTRVHVHMSQYDRRGPGQSLKTHPGWRYSSAGPYVPLWPKGTGAVPQNPSWVKVLKCRSICPIMTEGDRGSPSKPILGEGTRVQVHMSQYDRRGPGQSLKTHLGWRYSSACPYVPIWRKGTGADPQNPSWVKVLECMSICPNMTEGDRGSPSKPILGEGTRVHVHMSQLWPKGTGAVPQNPSWVKVLGTGPYVTEGDPGRPSKPIHTRVMSICPNMTEGDRGSPSKPIWVKVNRSICPIMGRNRGSPSKPILGEGTRVHVHMSQYDWRGPGQVLKTHLGWRYSSAGPYVPIWLKGTGAVPQNPSWVKVLECRSTCLNMSQGGQRGGCIPFEGEAYTIPSK